MIRVFICGAHSTGKTTMLQHLLQEPENDLHGETEVARKIMERLGWQRKDIEPEENPENFFNLQKRIMKVQNQVDRENNHLKRSYVCDRGIDPLIYCKMYLGQERLNQLLNTEEADECLQRHKATNTLTVILNPHPECIRDDGTRLTPKLEELNQFTDMLKHFLNDQGIAFETISELNLEKRVSILKDLINRKRNMIN